MLKLVLFVSLLIILVVPVYGQLADKTGLLYRLDIEKGGHMFEVETVSNFSIQDYSFDSTQNKLTLHILSGLENNFSEIIIPQELLSGDLTIYINDQQSQQDVKSSERVSFITLNFTGSGNNQIDIIGESYLDDKIIEQNPTDQGGGCLIATATYGTELAPQIQTLREVRDEKIMNTSIGTSFMETFNQWYYLFSPQIADYQRENQTFNEMVKITITPFLASLEIMSLADSEFEIIMYGSMIILINASMYIVAPILLVRNFSKLSN